MTNLESNTSDAGNEVIKETAKLETLVSEYSACENESETNKEEVAGWIAAIGKALLSIFR